jgi:hypothetical protein
MEVAPAKLVEQMLQVLRKCSLGLHVLLKAFPDGLANRA